jgi:putative ABC transport system permease protein
MNAYVKENIADAMVGMNTFQVRRSPVSLGLFDDEEVRRTQRWPKVDEAMSRRCAPHSPTRRRSRCRADGPRPRPMWCGATAPSGDVFVFGVTPEYQQVQDYRFEKGRPLSESTSASGAT